MPSEQDAHGSRDTLTELLLVYDQSDGSPEALERLTPVLYDRLREMARRHMCRERADHPDLAPNMSFLARILIDSGRADEAETLLREALDIQRLRLDAAHPMTLRTQLGLATVLRDQHRYDEAEGLLREVFALQRAWLGDDHEAVKEILNVLESLHPSTNSSDET